MALVTGADSGIGEAYAQSMAEAGADVVCVDIDFVGAKQIADQVRKLGKRAVAVVDDVSNEATTLVESTIEQWRRDIDVNLTGVYLPAREAAKVMATNRRGKIIATASIMAFRSPAVAARGQWYAVAKAGVVNLIRALGVELAGHNIQVNAIAPGYTRTGIKGGFLKVPSGPDIERIKSRTPIRSLAEPNEYKGVALFLASEASDLMTGFTVAVDSGYLAW